MTTPWMQDVTSRRIPFCCVPLGEEGLFIACGNDPNRFPFCRLTVQQPHIEVIRAGMATAVPVEPYRLHVASWTGRGVPRVLLHPFALPHLLVTGQVPSQDLLFMLGSLKKPALQASVPVNERRCELLQMLGISQAALVFATDFNLAVTRFI